MHAVMSFEHKRDIALDSVYTELLTPERFVRMYERERDNIESARAIPAPLGSRRLGRILVKRKRPLYAPLVPTSSDE